MDDLVGVYAEKQQWYVSARGMVEVLKSSAVSSCSELSTWKPVKARVYRYI